MDDFHADEVWPVKEVLMIEMTVSKSMIEQDTMVEDKQAEI
jgi:glycine cleavage system protein P-like pyridoxal-binding family